MCIRDRSYILVKHRSIVNFQNDMEGILRLIDAGAGGGVLLNQGVRGEQLQKVGDLGQDRCV